MTEVGSSPATHQKQQEESSPIATVSASPLQSSCREEHFQQQQMGGFPAKAQKSASEPSSEDPSISGVGKPRSIRRNSGAKRNALSISRDSVDFAARYGGKKPRFIPPNKFLLGGNIRDPLNLNSIPEVGPSGTTPAQSPRGSNESSPRLGPVEIKIPRWSRDPLNLAAITDTAPVAGRGRKRKRRDSYKMDLESVLEEGKSAKNEDTGSLSDSEIHVGPRSQASAQLGDVLISPEAMLPPKRPRGLSFSGKRPPYDPIVSPVKEKLPTIAGSGQGSPVKKKEVELKKPKEEKLSNRARARKEKEEKFNPNAARFRYGNYNRYYGKRLPDKEEDPRLKHFEKNWFENKQVLDIGCNIGHVTMILAREFAPAKIVGIDIDCNLIGVARKNVRRCLDEAKSKNQQATEFPPSFAQEYGPLSAPTGVGSVNGGKEASNSEVGSVNGGKEASNSELFPRNVMFRHGNYVLNSEELLETVKEEYDTIVALSVTKWIHLNWGDQGLKRFFKRAFRNLKPGGRLVLEPQAFSSYKKRKKLTPEILANYQCIQLKPDQFSKYLLSGEVGFQSCEDVGVPPNKVKGFQRPIQIFMKGSGEAAKSISTVQENSEKKTELEK